MASALKQLPEYHEVMSKLSQHMHVSHQCLSVFTREKLLDLAEFEQTLATGITEEGRTPKTADLLNDVEDKIRGMPPSNKAIAALRLLSILQSEQGGQQCGGPIDGKAKSAMKKMKGRGSITREKKRKKREEAADIMADVNESNAVHSITESSKMSSRNVEEEERPAKMMKKAPKKRKIDKEEAALDHIVKNYQSSAPVVAANKKNSSADISTPIGKEAMKKRWFE